MNTAKHEQNINNILNEATQFYIVFIVIDLATIFMHNWYLSYLNTANN